MNRGAPIRRPTRARATKPAPLPAHQPPPAPLTPTEAAVVVLRALTIVPPVWEAGGHE